MLRNVVGIVVLSLALGGCSDSGDDSEGGDSASTTAKPAAELVDTTIDRQYTITVAGARQFTFDGRVPVRFVTRQGEGDTLRFSLASVTLPTMLSVDATTTAAPEVAVVGMYKGDGTYRIPTGIGQAPTTGSTVPAPTADTPGVASVLQVTFGSETTGVRYGYLAEPCTVELDDNAREGKAECPALVGPNGERVSMKVSWKP